MRAIQYTLLAALLIVSTLIFGQNNEVIYIKAERFTQPLVEKWIVEYTKKNPATQIKIADSKQDSDISLVIKSDETAGNQNLVSIGRYALLPISNKNNLALEELNKNKLNKKVIKELFFENDPTEEGSKKIAKLKKQITIYSGNRKSSGSVLFASHFGYSPNDLRDKRISGDDVYLLSAMDKDATGVSINNLSYIYDIKTRKLRDNIALLPLDLKKKQAEVFESANLDDIIKLLENESVDLIPVNQIGFVYKGTDPTIQNFIQWVLAEGQVYNNAFGFLTLDKETYLAQQESIKDIHLTSHNVK